jgi:hypothetical protein
MGGAPHMPSEFVIRFNQFLIADEEPFLMQEKSEPPVKI